MKHPNLYRLAVVIAAGALVMACGDEADPDNSSGTGGTDTTAGTDSTGGPGTGGTDGTGGTSATDSTDGTGNTVCDPGEQFCNGQQLMTCQSDGGGYTAVECPNGCENAKCKSGCVPNTTFCKDSGTLITCDAGGNQVESVCDKGCNDGKCDAVEPICEPGQVLCEVGGKKLVKCGPDGTTATTYQVCPHGCSEGDSDCLEPVCEPDETKCAADDPKVVEVCLPDQTGWKKAPTPCKEKCLDGECWVPNCEPLSTQCGGLGVEKCDDAGEAYSLTKPCKVGCIKYDDGSFDCAKCDVGLKQCNVDGDSGDAIVEECTNAQTGFATTATCSELQACVAAKCTDVLVLSGDDSKAQTLLLVMKALVDCFVKAVDGSCRTIDASGLDYPITEDDLEKWFCDNKEGGGFAAALGSEDNFLAASDIVGGCSTFEANVKDMTFEPGQISPGKSSEECIGYSGSGGVFSVNSKEVIVDVCTNF